MTPLLPGWTVRRRGSSADTSLMLPSPVERLGCGAVAGLLGQASSYPLDIVRWRLTEFIISNMATIAFFRRRMQTSHQLGKGDKYKTVIGTLKTVYRYIQLLLYHFIIY